MIDGDDTYPAEAARMLIQPIIDNEADMVIGEYYQMGHMKRKIKEHSII